MKNVIILGAGASIEYGYPSGPDLIEDIKLEIFSMDQRSSLHSEMLADLEISTLNSIDAFLKNKPKYLNIGKSLISDVLFKKENPYKVFSAVPDSNFYKFFANKLIDSSGEYKLSDYYFITFNYDRSLEYFLANVLVKEGPFKDYPEVFNYLQNRILHVHGRLPPLPNELLPDGQIPRRSFHYGSVMNMVDEENIPDAEQLKKFNAQTKKACEDKQKILDNKILETCHLVARYSVNNFHIVYENKNKEDELKSSIRSILDVAERIFFLGFSFHPINMDILGIKDLSKWDEKKIAGTTFGMHGTDKRRIKRLYPEIKQYDCKCIELFQEYYSLTDRRDDVDEPPEIYNNTI